MGRFQNKLKRTIREFRYSLGWEQGLYPRRKSGDLIVTYHNLLQHSTPHLNVRNIGITEFENEINYFKKRFRIVSLREMMEEPGDGRRLAITFDDGLVNNLRYVLPQLENHEVPATFFVTASYLRGRSILWPDHISMTGMKTKRNLDFNGKLFHHRPLNRYIDDQGNKLTEVLMREPIESVEQFLHHAEIKTDFRPTDDSHSEPRWRVMRAEEVRILSESPLVEIGSHGIRHINLCLASPDLLREELADSKHYLETATGKKVDYFAFPFGLYNSEVVEAATAAGYKHMFAMRFREEADRKDPRLHERVGLFNDRSWIEQLHLVNKAFYQKSPASV